MPTRLFAILAMASIAVVLVSAYDEPSPAAGGVRKHDYKGYKHNDYKRKDKYEHKGKYDQYDSYEPYHGDYYGRDKDYYQGYGEGYGEKPYYGEGYEKPYYSEGYGYSGYGRKEFRLSVIDYCDDGSANTPLYFRFSCPADEERHSALAAAPTPVEVATCVLQSTTGRTRTNPASDSVGVDAFYGTCPISNTDTCGAPECSNVDLVVSGLKYSIGEDAAWAYTKPTSRKTTCYAATTIPNRVGVPPESGSATAPASGSSATTGAKPVAVASMRRESDDIFKGDVRLYTGFAEIVSKETGRLVGTGSITMYIPTGIWTKKTKADIEDGDHFVPDPFIMKVQYDREK